MMFGPRVRKELFSSVLVALLALLVWLPRSSHSLPVAVDIANHAGDSGAGAGVGTSLLAGILRRTLYSRMEGLILDGHPPPPQPPPPPPPSGRGPSSETAETRLMVEAAVRNYRGQKRTAASGGAGGAGGQDEFTTLAGYWIRHQAPPAAQVLQEGPIAMASTYPRRQEGGGGGGGRGGGRGEPEHDGRRRETDVAFTREDHDRDDVDDAFKTESYKITDLFSPPLAATESSSLIHGGAVPDSKSGET